MKKSTLYDLTKGELLERLRKPQCLSDRFQPIIWETHSLYDDEEDDFLNVDFTYSEISKDIQDMLGVDSRIMGELLDLDMIHTRKDCGGIWITYYQGNTSRDDAVISVIEPILEELASNYWEQQV